MEKTLENKKEYLADLVSRMAGERDGESYTGSEAVSWLAHREGEQLGEKELVPLLFELIEEEADINRQDKLYTLLGYVAGPEPAIEVTNFLLHGLENYDNERILYNILTLLRELSVTLTEEQAQKVLIYVDDDRQLIRNSAIRSLGNVGGRNVTVEDALIDILENAYDAYDLRYATQVLGIIGSERCMPYLETVRENNIDPEVTEAAISSIRKIRNA